MIKINQLPDKFVAKRGYTETGKPVGESKKNLRITFQGLEDKEFSVRAESRYEGKGLFSRLFSAIANFVMYAGRYIDVDVEDLAGNHTRLMVNINSLAKRLNIAKKEVVKNAKEGTLDQLIEKQSYLHQAKKYVEQIRNKYDLDVETSFYNVTDRSGKSVSTEISETDFEAYIRAVCLLKFAPHAPASRPDGVREVSAHTIALKDRKIHVATVPSATDQKMVGLFGKEIAQGGFGRIIHTVDVLEAKLMDSKDEMAVMKEGLKPENAETIAKSAETIHQLHQKAGGRAVGIQDRLIVVTDKRNRKLGCLSPLYDFSANKPAVTGETGNSSSLAMQAIYQLSSGIALMHANNMAHRDIKLDNIFVRMAKKDTGWIFDHGDFDGVGFHDGKMPNEITGYTSKYRPRQDFEAYFAAVDKKDLALLKKLDMQADIFALCTSLYALIDGGLPYKFDDEGFPTFNKDAALLNSQLERKQLDAKVRELIVRGLSQNPEDRPTAEELRDAAASLIPKAASLISKNVESKPKKKRKGLKRILGF